MKNQLVQKQIEQLIVGTHHIVPETEFIKKLQSGKQLTIKLGADPTAPDLHLGHAVVLGKLRQLQDMGHRIIFLIGDFTARIGDPTGKSKTRPPLSEAEIVKNTQTYFDQVSKILDAQKIEIKFNSEWLDTISMKELVQLCSRVTVARLIERDDFAQRIAAHQTIGFHELLYPLMQGYDSVELKADIELGGTDQTFNLLMGRFLQEQYGQEPQVVLTMPLLLGLDGVHKMSKSLGNAISLNEQPEEAYGKLMSISDILMWHYAELLLSHLKVSIDEMHQKVTSGKVHPMDAKKEIAYAIVSQFWGQQEAQEAANIFKAVVQKKEYSAAPEKIIPKVFSNPVWIVDLLKHIAFIKTSSEAKRLIESGSVLVDGQVITDFKAHVSYQTGTTVAVGKHRACRLIVE